MSKITGEEFYFSRPCVVSIDGRVEDNGDAGATLYQVALKDFMCAIASHPTPPEWVTGNDVYISGKDLAKYAAELTEAYINQLNKTI